MSDIALDIRDLKYLYRSGWSWHSVAGLKGITLQIKRGEAFGFLGHNGAGKTTTIKCVLDLVRPAAGSVSIFGLDSRDPSARQVVGFLPEQPYFYDNLTVSETLHLYGKLAGLRGKDLSQRVTLCIERVRLQDRVATRLRALSKGLTQRLALAQALLCSPQLLVLDEPFSGLDPLGRKEFRDIFTELKREGTTLFLSSHILSDVEHLCDRCSILVQGELKGVFVIKDIPKLSDARYELVVRSSDRIQSALANSARTLENYSSFLRAEFDTQEQAEGALRQALEAGARIESYQFVQGGLEELFVRLTQSRGEER